MDNQLSIAQALSEVMKAVGGIAKKDRNQSQGFNFRGIDSVVNAVSPQLQKFGVVVVPSVEDYEYATVEIGRNRTAMGHVRVRVRYTFVGPKGDAIAATVVGEAMDSGDKATAKAMSVAFRTALLQALCLPTDEPDPDATSYERSSAEDILAPGAILMKIAQSTSLDALSSVGAYLSQSKDKYSAEQMDQFRDKFTEKRNQLNVAKDGEWTTTVSEEGTNETKSQPSGVTV
jgi:hypothetical protein